MFPDCSWSRDKIVLACIAFGRIGANRDRGRFVTEGDVCVTHSVELTDVAPSDSQPDLSVGT